MKIKLFSILFSLILVSCFLFVPVSAAESSDLLYNGYSFPEIPSYDGVSAVFVDGLFNQTCFLLQFPSDTFVELVGTSLRLSSSGSIDAYVLVSGVWVFASSSTVFPFPEDSYFLWASSDILNSSGFVYFPGSDPFSISPSPVFGDGLYFQAYELLSDHVFGLDPSDMTSSQELMVSLASGLAVAFLIILPFILVWRVIRIFF